MEPEQQLRNLRDFLLVYNRMTEICFQRCSSNFNYRNLTMDEERCVDNCAGKLIRSNHRLMGTYVQLMPKMVQRRMEEMESKAKEAEAAAAAAAAATQGPPAAEAPTASQVPDSSSTLPEVPAPLPLVVTDVGPDRPVLNLPVDLDAVAPRSTAEAEASFSAAASFTPPSPPVHVEAVHPPALSETAAPPALPVIPPALKEAAAPSVLSEAAVLPVRTEPVRPPVLSEALNLPVLNETISGSSHTDMTAQLPTAAVHTESVSPAPVLMPLKPTSLSEDLPVSTVSAPALSVQQRGPEAPPPPSSQ